MKHLLLHYYLTNRCNSKCVFCDIWKETPKLDAKEDDVIRNLYSARKAGCSFVDFTGGEPLLHRSLPLFLSEAKKIGFITSVTTNCILFKKRISELDNLIDLLHFSIDSDQSEHHNNLRGVNCYDDVIESIEISKKYRLFPDLLFTYNDKNINEYAVASFGITKAEVKNGREIKIYVTGLGFLMSRVNVIPNNEFVKIAKKEKAKDEKAE